jgi:vanadium-dependent haloperoxidase-like protein
MSLRDPHRGRLVGVVAAAAGLVALGVVVVAFGVAGPARAHRAETVRDWNLHAVAALTNAPPTAAIPGVPPGAGQTPPVAQLHLAMVQGAVYDAVNAIDGGHEPYLAGLPAAPSTASQAAAVATAAHHVLVGLGGGLVPPLPAEAIVWLDTAYATSLAGIADGQPKLDGIAAGEAAAEAMLEERADDGRYVPFAFNTGTLPGQWRPTAEPPVSDPFAWVARVEPFLLESTSQLRTKGPHALKSDAYTKEYNEVKELGSLEGSSRTPEQTALADFYTVSPVELWNRTFRAIAVEKGLRLAEEARLFAMLNTAGADGLISCWDDKWYWSFWRPLTAIRLGDDDGNPKTVGDPEWTSKIPTPPYPDHPSGYNCVTSSYMETARDFFGTDKIALSVHRTTDPATDVTRNYERFSDTVKDTIDARVYQGLHFRAADVQAAGIGKGVAHWLDKHFSNR